MNSASNPSGIHKPLSVYSHVVKVPANADWLVISGQLGIDPQGNIARGVRAQTEQIYANILAGLRENGMDKQDLVKLTTYITDPRGIPEMRAARDAFFEGVTPPTSTLLVIDGLADPDFLIEIEAWAAKG